MIKISANDVKNNRRTCREFYSRVVSMRFSHYISAFCINQNIKANTVTSMMLYSAILCSFFLLTENHLVQVFGALLLFSVNVFDTADGEVARFTGNTSIVGVYYDKVYQILVDIFIFAIISYNQYIYFGEFYYIIPACIFLFFYVIDNYSKEVFKSLHNDTSSKRTQKENCSISYDRKSIVQFFVHITSSNTGFFHLYWFFLLSDYIFNTEYLIQFVFIIYFMVLQVVKTVARQVQMIKILKTNNEDL